jgi:hypothetical protein
MITMAQSFRVKQKSDWDAALSNPATRTLSAEKLIGQWVNTDPATRGIASILIEKNGDNFDVSATGVGVGGLIEWPRTRAVALANLEEEAGQRAVALGVDFEFGFMKAETYLRANKGVLVIVLFVTFKDGSARSNYVNREFFYKQN